MTSSFYGTPKPLGNVEFESLVPSGTPAASSSPFPMTVTETPRPMNARRAKFDPLLGSWEVGDATPAPSMDWYGGATFPQSFGFKFPSPNSLDWSMLVDLFKPMQK